MTHQGNCLHIAIQWFSLLRPGSVRWIKKWLDVPALALWCFGPKMILVPLPSVHWLELVTWTYLINSVLCWLKELWNMGKQKKYLKNATLLAIYDPRGPTCLPASPAMLRSSFSLMFQPQYTFGCSSCTPSSFLHEDLCSFSFSLQCFQS